MLAIEGGESSSGSFESDLNDCDRTLPMSATTIKIPGVGLLGGI